MKYAILFALVFCICMAYTQAQGCNPPRPQNCNSALSQGRGGRGCHGREMWHYRNGQCHAFHYRGCGGNGNRYCSKRDCERRCRRGG